jgi:magnesium and cobalt transporter
MNEDRSSPAPAEGRTRSWLERLSQAFNGEPKDRQALLEIIRDAHQREVIDRDACEMIEGVLEVSGSQVRDIMVPRAQIDVVNRDARFGDILAAVIESAHSRFPVIGESRDEVIGILLAKDLLPYTMGGREFSIRDVLRPALFVPESKRLNVLLREFRSSRNHMAIVVDEYGGVSGIVTIEDVLEEIVGEIHDEYDVEEDEDEIESGPDGSHLLRALTPIEDFNQEFNARLSNEEFDTIGGLLMGACGHLPKVGELIDLGGFRFEVMEADNRRLHKLRVERLPNREQESAGDEDVDGG